MPKSINPIDIFLHVELYQTFHRHRNHISNYALYHRFITFHIVNNFD